MGQSILIRFENIALRYKNTALASQQAASAWSPFKRGKAEPQDRTQNNSARSTTSPEILHNINLDLERGSFHFITGVSGAGKSSLLNLINLSIRPTSGKIYLAGQDTTVLDADERALMRRRIGVVFQDYRLLDHLSVEENVALPLRIAGAYDQQRRNDVLDLLTWVGLGDKLNLPPRVLSGGQKQRVALARAVITRPQLLLADEPTGNLDDGMGTRLVRLFEELNRIGTTVIIATHNQDLLRAFRFPVINLKDGKAKVDQIGNLYPLTKEASSQPSDKPVFSS